MTELDVDAAEAIEDRLEAWPGAGTHLDDALLARFNSTRRRIHQRHNEWRRGMPALDDLFEDDCHRAKALAGSLATELDRVFELHGSLVVEGTVGSEWPRRWAEDWQREAAPYVAAWGWGDAAARMFELVLSDLCAQAVDRAERGERPRTARPEVEISGARRLMIRASRLIRRFLRPDLRA